MIKMYNVTSNTQPIIDNAKILISTCKAECTARCNEYINKSMFNEYLWLLYAGLVVISIFYWTHDANWFRKWCM